MLRPLLKSRQANDQVDHYSLPLKVNLLKLVLENIFLSAFFFALIFVFMKPLVFKWAFIVSGERKKFAKEAGLRLGQFSEFSLLVALLAFEVNQISIEASQFIQLVTILSFIASSYIVVYRYPTPIGVSTHLIKD